MVVARLGRWHGVDFAHGLRRGNYGPPITAVEDLCEDGPRNGHFTFWTLDCVAEAQ